MPNIGLPELIIILLVLAVPVTVVVLLLSGGRRRQSQPLAQVSAQTGMPVQSLPGWYPDPAARHEHRYWDGLNWTTAVSDGAVTGTDPLPGADQRPVNRPE